jgi:hypothetical protein
MILNVREKTVPIRSQITNAYIVFLKMTCSVVTVITHVMRDGQAVVGYASIQTAAPTGARYCTSVSPDLPAQDRRNDRSPRWPEIVRVSAIPRFLPAR